MRVHAYCARLNRVRRASGALARSFKDLVVLVRPGRVAGRIAGRVWTLTTRFSHVRDQQKLDFDVSGTQNSRVSRFRNQKKNDFDVTGSTNGQKT